MDRIEMVGDNYGKIGLSVELCSSVLEISISLLLIVLNGKSDGPAIYSS